MGRRCLLTSWIGLCLGTGTISASFQDKGSRPSRKEVFMISMMGGAKSSSFSSNVNNSIICCPKQSVYFDPTGSSAIRIAKL